MPEFGREIEKDVPEFGYRLKVKAGLTGYAQVYGKYNTTFYDKLKLDLMYIRKYSLLLKTEVDLMTPKIMFLKESTRCKRMRMKPRIQILLLADYKPTYVLDNRLLVPIQVGTASTEARYERMEYDNNGDNISEKLPVL